MGNAKSSSEKSKMNPIEKKRYQAELFECVVSGKADFQQLFEKHKDILDEDIIVYTGSICNCARSFESMPMRTKNQKLLVLDEMTRNIRVGHCSCPSETPSQSPGKEVSLKLVHLAAGSENFEMLKSLIDLGCSGNVCSRSLNLTPLFLSVFWNEEKQVDLLIEQEVDVNCKCLPEKASALSRAVSYNFKNIVRKLLNAKNIDVNVCNNRNETPLIFALRVDGKEILEMLLNAGADVNVKDAAGNTPTMLASVKGIEYLEPILSKNPDINCKNQRSETALFYATYVESDAMVKLLLEKGADPDLVNSEGMTVLLTSACQGSTSVAEILLQHKADINITNAQGYGAVHMAAWNKHTRMLKLFLEQDEVDHDKQTGDKNTPLALAAHGNHAEAIDMLLPLKCNVNNADKDKDTALHYAAYNGMTESVRKLLQHGADPEALNNFNTSPLWNAVCMKHKDVVKLLLAENIKMEVPSVGIHQHMQSNVPITVYSSPRSPLYVAAHKETMEILCLLIAAGYDIYKEEWLYDRSYPFPKENGELVTLLTLFSGKPPTLISACRNYLRRYFGRKIHDIVDKLEIPLDLKNFLLLKDLIHVPVSK